MKKYKVLNDMFAGFEADDIIVEHEGGLGKNCYILEKQVWLPKTKTLPVDFVESHDEYFEEIMEPKHDELIKSIYDFAREELKNSSNMSSDYILSWTANLNTFTITKNQK